MYIYDNRHAKIIRYFVRERADESADAFYPLNMPTFFFRFRTGKTIQEDPNGLELPDVDAAREEAVQTAREIVGDAVRFARTDVPDHIMIVDAGDHVVSIVPLADVLPRCLQK